LRWKDEFINSSIGGISLSITSNGKIIFQYELSGADGTSMIIVELDKSTALHLQFMPFNTSKPSCPVL
jgi:hypothetical protein